MPLYTFFPRLPGGASLSFQTHDLPSDRAAEAFALAVLEEHRTCASVAVWSGDREVCIRRRGRQESEAMGLASDGAAQPSG